MEKRERKKESMDKCDFELAIDGLLSIYLSIYLIYFLHGITASLARSLARLVQASTRTHRIKVFADNFELKWVGFDIRAVQSWSWLATLETDSQLSSDCSPNFVWWAANFCRYQLKLKLKIGVVADRAFFSWNVKFVSGRR